jgi:membrane protease YdiL (CAAX protease family)
MDTLHADSPNNAPTAPEKIPFAWRGKDVAFILLAMAGIFFIGIVALNGLLIALTGSSVNPEEPNIFYNAGLGALEGVAIIGSVCIFGLLRRRLPWSAVGLRAPDTIWWALATVAGLVAIPLSGLVAILVQLLRGQGFENPQLPFLAPDGFTWFGFLSMLLLGGVIAPFAEELFFRGVLYPWLRGWGVNFGIIVSSVIFGAVHGELSVGASAAVLGLIMAWLVERSQSLWPAVVVHILNNSVKIILLYVLLATGYA